MQSGDKKSIWPKSKKAPLLHDFFPAFFCALFLLYYFLGWRWRLLATVPKIQKYKKIGRPAVQCERKRGLAMSGPSGGCRLTLTARANSRQGRRLTTRTRDYEYERG